MTVGKGSQGDSTPTAPASSPRGGLRRARGSDALVLRLGERLDLASNDLVQQAIAAIEATPPARVIVDLAATRTIFDSGLALLLLLRARAPKIQHAIHLVNCAPRVYERLVRAGISSQFRIAWR